MGIDFCSERNFSRKGLIAVTRVGGRAVGFVEQVEIDRSEGE